MLKKSVCSVSELIPRLGGTFCGEKLVVGFGLLKRRVEIDPATFSKTKLDQLIKEDKFMVRITPYDIKDNDQSAEFNTSVRKERAETMPGTKGYTILFNKGNSFQNELAKIHKSKEYGFVPIFEDGTALFAEKKNGMLTGFDCNLFVDVKKLQTTTEVAGSTLHVDITPDAMIYWQAATGVFESDEFSFNEIEPVAKIAIETPVLTNGATTTKVKVTEAFSGANVVGLTNAEDWKIEEDGVIKNITQVTYDASAQEYTLKHAALTTGKKTRFITSNSGLRVISVDTNFYSGESVEQAVA